MKYRNNESYTSAEYAEQQEYKAFKAEQYIKAVDYNPTPPEETDTGPETQFGNSVKPLKKEKKRLPTEQKSKRESFTDAFNKLKSSLSSIGGSAVGSVVAAAAAVVICVSLFITPPKADDFSFFASYDEISFSLAISEMNSDVDYDVILYNENESYVIDEITEGLFEGSFEGLTPKTDYILALIGKTGDGTEETYLTENVFTMPQKPDQSSFSAYSTYDTIYISLDTSKLDTDTVYYLELSNGDRLPINNDTEYVFENLLPNEIYTIDIVGTYREFDLLYNQLYCSTLVEFDGNITPPDLLSSVVAWGDSSNEITLPFTFDKGTNDKYQYGVILSDEDGNELSSYFGTEGSPVFNIDADKESIYIDYQLIYVDEESSVICKSYSCGMLDLSAPKLEISPDKSFAPNGAYSIPFNITSRINHLEDVGTLTYTISYEGAEALEFYHYEWTSNRVCTLLAEMPSDVSEFSLYMTLEYEEMYGGNLRTVSSQEIKYTNEIGLTLINAYADLSYYGGNRGYLDFGYCAPRGSYIEVTPNGGAATILDSYTYSFASNGVQSFTYQLKDIDGNPLSELGEVTFDTNFDRSYTFSNINPGDAVVTINEDETINIYLNVSFETENTDMFYEIKYGQNIFTSREKLAKIENIPADSYGLSYKVIVEKNGVRYILNDTTPSGTVDLIYTYDIELEETDTGVSIGISRYINFKEDSIITVTINDKTFEISSNEIYDDNYYIKYFDFEVSEEIFYVAVSYIVLFQNIDYYNELVTTYGDQIKGLPYLEFTDILR